MNIKRFFVRDTAGFVYFLKLTKTGEVKIGKTTRLEKRLLEHNQNFDFEVIQVLYSEDNSETETLLHQLYKNKLVQGQREIFNLDDQDIDDIKNMNFSTEINNIISFPNNNNNDKISKTNEPDFNDLFKAIAKSLVTDISFPHDQKIVHAIKEVKTAITEIQEYTESFVNKLNIQSMNLEQKKELREKEVVLFEREQKLNEMMVAIQEKETYLSLKDEALAKDHRDLQESYRDFKEKKQALEDELELTRKYLRNAEYYISWDDKVAKHYLDRIESDNLLPIRNSVHYSSSPLDKFRVTQY
jgi:hypothetical protein